MLFCLISLVGTASAEDISDNEIISYDDTIDMSTENSNLQEVSNLNSNDNSNSNDISNEISNVDDTADDTSTDVDTGSSSKNVIGASKLGANHDLSGSTLQDIQDYLNSGSVAEGDTIYLGNQTWNSGSWGPYNGGPVQINIPNLIISGGTSGSPNDFATISAGSRIFQLNAPGITLKNIAFTNTPADGPCCAVNIQQADCTITNCVFDSCRSQNGGAIYGGDSASNTKINNCIFNNCTSMWSSAGAAIYHEGSDLTISNCNFTNNQVDGYGDGGAIALQGSNAKVTDCNFLNNKGSNGGAIYVHVAGSTITNCNFENNSAVSGGAINIYHDDTNINGCNFTNNSANGQGGAIYIGWDCNRQIISNCDFNNNSANSTGGAIYADSEGNKVTYSNFTGNSAPNGGAIQLGSDSNDFNLEHVIFENNHAYVYQGEWGPIGGQGGAINTENHHEHNQDIFDVTFINNTADVSGGAVKHHANWTFTDCAFINNSANPDNNPSYTSDNIQNGGGALWCCDGITNLVNTDFIGNNATFGGAIRGAVNARDCVVENNTAFNGNGGGIDLTIEEGLFNNESFMTSVQIRDSNFTGNSAEGEYKPTEDAKGGKAQGGAIHIYRVEGMVLDNITCTDNTAYRGGAIDLYVMNYTTITNSNISDNTATLGGGIAVVGDNCLFLNLTLANNYAEDGKYDGGEGGAIWVNGSNTLFENSTLDQNVADTQGGGIMSRGSNCSFVNNNLTSNEAYLGGGIAVESHDDSGFAENITFYNNTLLYNEAYAGGGVLVQADQVNFTDNVISNNTAATTGGAFYVVGDELYIDNLTSDYNTALNGGSCAIYSCDGLIVKNSTFTGNQALVEEPRGLGGAMHLSRVTSADIQANFYNNTAKNGSAIYSEKSTGVYIHDSDFVENQAYSYILSITPENNTVLDENEAFNITVTHVGGDNIMNAIYNTEGSEDIGFTNVTYPFLTVDGQEIIRNTNDGYSPTEVIHPVIGVENSENGNLLYQDDLENNQIINILVKDKNGNIVEDISGKVLDFNGLKSDIFGTVTEYVAGLKPGRYYVEAKHPEDTYYKVIANLTVLRVGPTDLEINKTVSNATCNVSDIVDWNVTTGNIGPIDAENVTVRDILPEGLDLLNLTFSFVDSINGNWCTGKLDLSSNTLTYGVYNATAGTWTYNEASYDGTGTWTIVIPDIDGNDDILKPVTISLTLNKGSDTTVTLFVSDLLEQSSVVMNLVTNVTEEGEFTNFANVTTDTPETNYTNNNATNTTKTGDEVTNLTVIKVWDDNNNQDGVRPVNVTVELFADGVKINETVLNEGNGWKFTFTDLPVKNNGQVINYTVNETAIANYTAVITNETAYNWTVINNHTPLVTEVNVTKVWDDNNNQDDVRPVNVTVELFADGVKINETVLNEGNSWKFTFPELPVYNNGKVINYTVNETPVANYTVNITVNADGTYVINNTHVPLETEVNVTKVWDDENNQDGVRPVNVTVELFADGVKINETVLNEGNGWKFTFPNLPVYKDGVVIVYTVNETPVANYTVNITVNADGTFVINNTHIPEVTELNVTKVWNDENNQDGVRPVNVTVYLFANGNLINQTVLTADNDWKHTFPDLDVYENGQVINYTIAEVAVTDYTVVITNDTAYDWTVTNTYVPNMTEVNVTKVWDDNNNQDGVRPVNVTVELFADGVKINETVLSADNEWKFTFPNLPVYKAGVLIVYTVNETPVANYTVNITVNDDGTFVINNTHVPEVTEVNVTKVWDDENNQDGVRPVNVTVELFADGVKINGTVLSADNDWKFTFPNLPVYKDGVVIVYTVNETPVANYTVDITVNDDGTFVINNTHVPLVTEVNVTKVWTDNDDQDKVRPVNVTVELFANGVKINETILSEENGWKFTFPELPVYEGGVVIVYSVNETPVANYTVDITVNDDGTFVINNTHVPEVTEVNVTKVWDDENNQDGVRPVNVTVELFADGVKINETVLNEGNGWKFTFPNLPVYKDGVVIVYTVNETPVANYTVDITVNDDGTFVINNTHVPLVTELNVTKVWDDSDNQDGVRPVNVTVYLFANGNLINQTVLTADNDWKHTFPDLDVYENGQVINYTIAEVAVTDYTIVITNDTAYDWTVTNTYVPNMTEVNVTKVWDDANNQDGVRPVNVTVELFADGVKINETVLSADNDWKFTFPNLPVYKDGVVIVYTVNETPVANYTVDITVNDDGTFVINNTHVPLETEVNVTKVWDDENNQDGVRPVNVTVELFADGVKINETVLSADNEWKFTFPNLPVYKGGVLIVYTVNETPVANYTVDITVNDDGTFVINNTHVPLVTEVNVTKVWTDNDDQDKVRPVNVTVELFADGVKINETVLSADNDWKFTFPNLPVYKDGVVIVYTVNETPVANYTVDITVNDDGTFVINNTHVPEVTEVNVTKVWDDENNQDGVRPVNVTVELFADGVKINETVLNEGNGWKFTFPNLPVYKDGVVIVYTVNETPVANYTVDITVNDDGTFVINNTHVPLVTELNVTKVWNDSDNQDGVRPVNVTVYLFANGNLINQTVLTADNDWKHTFPDLDVYENGQVINYTIAEVAVTDYTIVITNDTAYDWTVTNTYVPNMTEVNVTKVWDDANNQDGVRPVNVTVELFADGVKINETVLSADNDWKFTFPNLPVYKDGVVIVYTVNETPVANYTVDITVNDDGTFVINNTHVPEVTEVNVTKVWDDENNQDGVRPVNVTVELFADGVKINETVLSADNEWKFTFPNLPVYKDGVLIVYTVNETPVANYTVDITVNDDGTFVINNTHVPLVTEVNVTKVWTDNDDQDKVRPVNVTVELFADGVKINETVLSADNDWKFTFPELPVYKDGVVIVYTVNETPVANYTVDITVNDDGTFVINNTHVPEVTEVNVTKVWDDENNQDGVRPVNVTVELFADGVKINETVLSADNEWKFTFPNLPVYKDGVVIVYTVNETPVANYTVNITVNDDGTFVINNTHVPLVTELNVTKVWDDANNQDGVRPVNVTVYLFANGNLINQTVLTADNDWKHTFPDLDVYENGQVINYTIAEVAVTDYTIVITNDTAYDWTVTNTYVPNMTEVNVTKVWDDANNQDGVRPVNVTVELFADGVKINETVLSADNEWKFTFPNLPAYKDGVLIVYTVNETPVANYTVNITVNDDGTFVINNTHIPEVTEVNVTKVWTDNDNQDGVRPVNVTVELFADGVKINETVLSADNDWKFTFPELPVYKDGVVIVYTVNETPVANYTVNITVNDDGTFVINNTHIPEITELNVTKVWNDANNQDGVRPVNVTVELFADGVKINETVLSADNDWKFTFPNLPVYKDGVVIVYTVNETPVANYTVDITVNDDGTFVINNTHIPEITELNVTKVWNDANNQDGVRPVNVTVELFADGVKINETVLSADNEWKFTFPNLPVYKDGVLIVYTVNETPVANYTVNITVNDDGTFVINNTHIPEVTELNVTKVWNDSDNQDGIRSVNVTVYLFANGNLINQTVLTADNDWKHIFTDLAVYNNGQVINYTIAEVAVTDYTIVITNDTAYNWTVTNTHESVPNMTIVKIANEKVVYVGNETSFTIVVNNTGSCNLSDVVVTDVDFDEGLEFNGVWTNGSRGWSYDGAGHWKLDGILVNGSSASFTVYFNVTMNGTLVNNASVVSNLTNETNATNNTTAYKPNLTVEKIADNKVVYVGNETSFTIFVKNTGDCVLHNVTVTESWFSEGLEYNDVWVPNGHHLWDYNKTTRTWTLIGSLPVEDFASFIVYFNVTQNGTLYNNVTAKTNETNDTNATNNTTAYAPNMTVQKVTLDKEVYVGNTTRFTIVVENTGDCELDKVYVVDTDYDHSALHYLKYENGSRNWNYDEQYSKWILAGPLAVGEKANFTVWFEVLTNGTFVNNVTAGSNLTNETNGTNNTTAKPICDLVITKIVNTTHCYVDDLVEWNITVANRGPSTALDVIVKDVLPEGLQLIDVRGGNYDNDTHEWTIGTLDKNQSVSIVLVTKVLINGTIQNNASVNTTIEESNYTNNNDSDTTKADYLCDLVIKKAVNCTNCIVGDIVEWNITVVNVGPHSASNVIVKDILPKGMELINYRVSVGNFNKVISEWSIGTLEKDTAVSLVLVTKVLIDGTFVNIATVNTTTPESNYTNNRANNTTVASPICDLVISKLVNATKVYKGDIVKWTIKVTNKGPSTAFNVKVKDVLPKGLKLMDLKASKGKYQNGVWTIGKLTKGSSATLTLITKTTKVGKIRNIASVNTTTPESNYTNNKANNTTEVMPICDLVLYKSSDKHVYNVNDTMHWIIKVVNKGPDGAVDAYVKDVLPNSTEFVSYTSSKGSYNKTNGVWRIGDVAAGEEVTLTITCKILSAGSITNKAVVYNKVKDKNSSNNWDNATIKVAEPIPNPPEPNRVNLSLKTGNPLVVLLIAFITIFGGIGLRCRKE